MQRAQGYLPFNPQNFSGAQRNARPGLQHRDQLYDQHELAVLLGRIDLELLRADGGADGAEFASAAAGIAVAIALVRGFARQEKKTIGNFWVDVTRATVYVLLPMSIVGGLLFCLAGRDSESASPTRS